MCSDWEKVDEESPFMPMPVLIAKPANDEGHISGRLFLDNMCHESMAGTGAVCITACSRTPGTLVHNIVSKKVFSENVFKITHPLGIIPVVVKTTEDMSTSTQQPQFQSLSFLRTARRIMDGQIYVPEDLQYQCQPNSDAKHPNGSQVKVGIEDTTKPILSITDGDGSGSSVTTEIAEFVATVTFDTLDASTRAKLKELLLDFIGVTVAAAAWSDSTKPILEAMLNLGAANGASTVLGKGAKFQAQYAALLNGALGHSLEFDDTYAAGSLHAGVTTIAAGLAQAELSGSDGKQLLIALAVGYEVTCRLGKELGFRAYERGFHNTSTAGIFGAVATIAKLKKLPRNIIEMAFGLAGSKAAGSMQYLDNGSWNKRLHPGFAAHDAFMCVSLAESGVIGATKIFEGTFGFFNAYTANANVDWNTLVADLGKHWEFTSTAIKPFPACRMTHGVIELATAMSKASNGRRVQSMEVVLGSSAWSIVGQPVINKTRPQNVVDAQFSIFYQTALAWLDGLAAGWRIYDRINDEDVQDLLQKITCVAEDSYKRFETILKVNFEDGSQDEKSLMAPLGEASNPLFSEQINAKYTSLVEPVYGNERTTSIADIVESLENYDSATLMKLLA